MRRLPPRSLAIGLAGVTALSLTAAACGDEPSTVAIGHAARATVVEVVDAPAAVTARAAATLTTPADGVLTQLRVRAGERVTAGQVLAVIDSPSARGRLKQAREALRAARRAGSGGGGDLDSFTEVRRSTDQAATDAFDTAREAAAQIADEPARQALLAQVELAQQQYAAAAEAADEAVESVREGVAGLNSAMGALGGPTAAGPAGVRPGEGDGGGADAEGAYRRGRPTRRRGVRSRGRPVPQ